LDAERLSRIPREPEGACIVVASGTLDIPGVYALEARDARDGLPEMRGHILAYRNEPAPGDALRLLLLLLAVVATLIAATRWTATATAAATATATETATAAATEPAPTRAQA